MSQGFAVFDLDAMLLIGDYRVPDEDPFTEIIASICEPFLPPSRARPDLLERRVPIRPSGSPVSLGDEPISLRSLPCELIGMIFDHIDSYYDALFLSLTCNYMWQSGRFHIRSRYPQLAAPCRGHRIINLGSCAQDLPPHFFTLPQLQTMVSATSLSFEKWDEERVAALCDDENDDNQWTSEDIEWRDGLPCRVQYFCYKMMDLKMTPHAFPPQHHGFKDPNWEVSWGLVQWRGIRDCRRDFRLHAARDWTESLFKSYKQRGDVMVLRNHCKVVYVRSDTFSLGRGESSDPTWAFGRLLYYHTIWTEPDSPVYLTSMEGLRRGSWAGDRFDVVTLRTFEASTSNQVWEDVTSEMRESLLAIWESDEVDTLAW